MICSMIIALLGAGFSIAAPVYPRDVTLDSAAVAEAQVRDNTATRAFSAAQIQVRIHFLVGSLAYIETVA